MPQAEGVAIEGGKHRWVGEPSGRWTLDAIVARFRCCQDRVVIGGSERTSPGVTSSTDPPNPPPRPASAPTPGDDRLTATFRQYSGRVYAYARRHVEDA